MKKSLSIISIIILTIFLFGLSVSFYYLSKRVEYLAKSIDRLGGENRSFSEDSELVKKEDNRQLNVCSDACKEEIERVVSNNVATLSVTKVVTGSVGTPSPKTTYIPLGTTYATTSTDWVSIDETKVYIDLENDYGKNAKVSWEASLKVAHANGKAFARLYDDTNKIAVDFSEISTENNSAFKQVSTGNLPFWRGRNLYLVQVKSLNSFEVTYSGGRIKVSY